MGEGIVRKFGMDMDTRLFLTWRTKKDLLDGRKNSAQCYMAAWMRGEFGGIVDTCMCTAESLCCSPETTTALLISYPPTHTKKSLKFEKERKKMGTKIFISIQTLLQLRKMCLIHKIRKNE